MVRKALIGLLFLGAPCAYAIGTTALTIGASSVACVASNYNGGTGQLNSVASALFIQNASTSATIAVALSQQSLPTAGINAAGSVTLGPGQSFTLVDGALGGAWVSCIASGASTPVTEVIR